MENWIKTSFTSIKNWPSIASCHWQRCWVNTHAHTITQSNTHTHTHTHIYIYIYIYIYHRWVRTFISLKNIVLAKCVRSVSYICIIIIIIIMSCREHGYPWPSLATSPYHSSPLAGLQGYIPYPQIAAVCIFELLISHMWGVHRSTSLMSSSLLLHQCPACLVRLTWIVFVMGGRWPYSWCLVGWVLPPGLQYCAQHSCVMTVKLLLQPFS